MENNKFAEVLARLAENTIGMELNPTKPRYSTEEYTKMRQQALDELDASNMKDDEYIAEGFDIRTGKPTFSIQKKPIEYEECSWDVLSNEDWDVIENATKGCGLTRSLTDGWDSPLMRCKSDDSLFSISTSDASWRSLCGRSWTYNRSTKTITLVRMN